MWRAIEGKSFGVVVIKKVAARVPCLRNGGAGPAAGSADGPAAVAGEATTAGGANVVCEAGCAHVAPTPATEASNRRVPGRAEGVINDRMLLGLTPLPNGKLFSPQSPQGTIVVPANLGPIHSTAHVCKEPMRAKRKCGWYKSHQIPLSPLTRPYQSTSAMGACTSTITC